MRKLRLLKGISQQRLADVVGVSQQAINKYENHGAEPDIYILIKLADYFETTVDYLIGHTAPTTDQNPFEELELSKEELSLVRNFRKLSKDEKESIRLIVKNYLGK